MATAFKRTAYGAALRRLRVDAGLSLVDVQAVLDCSIPLISRVERGVAPPFVGDQLRQVLSVFGADDRFDEFMKMAAEED